MKTKNYISVFSLLILLFGFLQPVKAQTWEEIAVPDVNGYEVGSISVVKGFDDAIYLCTNMGVFRSLDNGTTYTSLTWDNEFSQFIQSVFVDKSNGDIYIGSEDGVRKSTDDGATWTLTAIQNSGK